MATPMYGSANAARAEELDVEFLGIIYEIIRSIDRDPIDSAQKARDTQDTTHKILELNNKLQQCREQIQKLPGIECSKEEQLKRLEALRKQLILKKELLLKYRNIRRFMMLRWLLHRILNNEQLIEKLSQSYPIRRAAQMTAYLYNRAKMAQDDISGSDAVKRLSERKNSFVQ
ncbi:unnamed protein product, partial [Darwinula stevensoni]